MSEILPPGASYQQGFRAGLATAALAIAFVAYIHLMDLEKSILAVTLAGLALRGAVPAGATARRRGRLAIIVAALHVVLFIVLVTIFRDRIGHAVMLLQRAAG